MSIDEIIQEDGEIQDLNNLIDCNEDGTMAALQRETKRKLLRESLANNGYALRKQLIGKSMKSHYTSPLTGEAMSFDFSRKEIGSFKQTTDQSTTA
jgi:hypothetical protein